MAILKIITAPDPILAKVAASIEKVNDDIRILMDNMLSTMYENRGVGLAAPQVGVSKRVVVIDLQNDEDQEREKGFYPLFMANPEITEISEVTVIAEEACLSVPEQRISVERPKEITVEYLDYNNEHKSLTTSGWLARAIQHEKDHLDGIILINYLSRLKKDMVIRRLKKIKKLAA